MASLNYTITPRSINVLVDGRPRAVDASSPNFEPLKAELKKGVEASLDVIRELADLPRFLALSTAGRVQVGGEEIRFDGKPIAGIYVDQTLALLREGFDIAALAHYLDKREQNPSVKAREELDLFLQSGNFVLTPDGDILAFKKVNDDYTSYHRDPSGEPVYNRIGDKPSMPRETVDPNRSATCSRGLHFCSFSYLPHYYGGQGRVVIVKINPADVVSIPHDYNNSKGRAWTYEVVGEVPEDEASKFFDGRPLVSDYNGSGAAFDDDDDSEFFGEDGSDNSDDTSPEAIAAIIGEFTEERYGDFYPENIDTILDEDRDEDERREALKDLFGSDWGATPQGYEFWDAIDDELLYTTLSDKSIAVLEGLRDAAAAAIANAGADGGDDNDGGSETVLVFKTKDGRQFTADEIKKIVEEHGYRGGFRNSGIPESTLRGWMSQIREAAN